MRSRVKQYAIENFPRLYVLADQVLSRRRYGKERGIIKNSGGRELSIGSGLVFFTYYRCGSQFAKRVIDIVLESQPVVWKRLDFEGYLFHFEPEKGNLFNRFDEISESFKFSNCVYGPIYHPVPQLLDHDVHRKVCILRDPRDVLVSHYYSTAFAHTVTSEVGLNRRKKAAEKTVDEFVTCEDAQNEVLERYSVLLEYFVDKVQSEKCLFIRYEDLMADFSGQVRRLGDLMEIDISEELLKKNQPEVKTPLTGKEEDVRAHNRSGASGQFRKKLMPETVQQLNSRFASILGPWSEL